MLRVAFGQLRHRLGRTLALLLGIAVAATSFSVLTGAAETTRLKVRGTVTENFRSTYDLLVRPADSYTELESEQGLVRPNYQSGIFGGITLDQVAAIRSVTSVKVAAPVANLGYVNFGGGISVPIKPYLNSDAQQLFRITPTWTMDRGLSRFVGAPGYVYVSRNRTVVLDRVPYSRGSTDFRDYPTFAEQVPGRRDPVPACTNYQVDQSAGPPASARKDPFGYRDPYARTGPGLSCYYVGTRAGQSIDEPLGAGDPERIEAIIDVPMPALLTAVDPQAEAQLFGLDQAVTSGRALSHADVTSTDEMGNPEIPVLAATGIDLDQQASATVERVEPPSGGRLSDALAGQQGVVDRVARLRGRPIDQVAPVPADQTYADSADVDRRFGSVVTNYWQVGPSSYDRSPDGEPHRRDRAQLRHRVRIGAVPARRPGGQRRRLAAPRDRPAATAPPAGLRRSSGRRPLRPRPDPGHRRADRPDRRDLHEPAAAWGRRGQPGRSSTEIASPAPRPPRRSAWCACGLPGSPARTRPPANG